MRWGGVSGKAECSRVLPETDTFELEKLSGHIVACDHPSHIPPLSYETHSHTTHLLSFIYFHVFIFMLLLTSSGLCSA